MTSVEGTRGTDSVKGHRDFARLWLGQATSQFGSAVGMVVLPVIAVEVLEASTFEVAALSASSALCIAVVAFPMGSLIEYRRRRPVMVGADIARALTLLGIVAAGLTGYLSLAHLFVAAVITALGQISYQAANQAHLKSLVGSSRILDANGRLESTQWLSLTIGPTIGGTLIALIGPFFTLIADAVTFLISALSVRSIRAPEPLYSGTERREGVLQRAFAALPFVWRHPTLKWMFVSWLSFAGAVAMGSAVSAVFYLRDLDFTVWQYGLILGPPSFAGFIGARLARRLATRKGIFSTLRTASLLRAPWQFLIPLAVPGTIGLAMVMAGVFGVLFFAGMANSSMTSLRTLETPDELMVRVSTLWSFGTTVSQPAFMVLGGVLATASSPRVALGVSAALMLVASLVLLLIRRPLRSTLGRP